MFFQCSLSKQLWSSFHAGLMEHCDSFSEDSRSWNSLSAFLKDKDLVETGMIILWMIWNNRNNCIHQLTCRRAVLIKITIETMVKDFISVNSVHPAEEQKVWSEWNPPPWDGIKINVDERLTQ